MEQDSKAEMKRSLEGPTPLGKDRDRIEQISEVELHRRDEESLLEGGSPGLMEADERARQARASIRAEDIEPYFALQYVARLFKIASLVVIVALTAEVVAGIVLEGVGAILPLFAEVIRGIVLAAILWGVGDLTVLFIDVGHDVRAARVLLGRMSARSAAAEAAAQRDDLRSD